MLNGVAPPRDSKGFEPHNRLLAALPGRDLQSLQPHIEAAPLARGRILFEVGESLTCVYFVETGVVSLLAGLENRTPIGVATLGPEGVVGVAALLLGGDTALGRSLTMEVLVFRSALRQSAKLRAACDAYARALLVQMLQAVPCNRLHTMEQRCARWLLMCADRTEGDTFELAPEGLAEMLGAPQSTATAIARALQRAGLIRYRRGAITMLDRRGLEEAACECYRIVRDRSERQLARAFH